MQIALMIAKYPMQNIILIHCFVEFITPMELAFLLR